MPHIDRIPGQPLCVSRFREIITGQIRLLRRKILLFVLAAAVSFCTSCGTGDAKATTMYLVKTTGSVGVTDGDGASVALPDRLGLYSGYVLESPSDSFARIDTDDALPDFEACSDVDFGEGGPFRIYIDNDGSSIDMAAFDGE